MKSLQLDERGYFWWADEVVPDSHFAPEGALPGHIQVTAKGTIKVIIDGHFRRATGRADFNSGPQIEGVDEIPLLGILKKGRNYLRLEGLQQSGFAIGGPDSSATYRARLCVKSKHLLTGTWPGGYCKAIKISLAGFDDWLQLPKVEVESTEEATTARITATTLRNYDIKGAVVSVGVDLVPDARRRLREVLLRQDAYIVDAPRLAVTSESVRRTVARFEDLLVLLTDCECSVGLPLVKVEGGDEWCEIYYQSTDSREQEISRDRLWTVFPRICQDFGRLIEAWLENSEVLGPGFHLYLGNRRGMPSYVEHRFINLAWGLESFHRARETPQLSTRLEEKKDRILAKLEGKDKRWLAKRFKILGGLSLHQRIFDLLRQLPLDFDEKELQAFAKKCADHRNIISHHGGRPKGKDYDRLVQEGFNLSLALDPLYHALILKEIGLSDDIIRSIFTKPHSTSNLRGELEKNGLKLQASEDLLYS